jgi:CBS domain-containing protein
MLKSSASIVKRSLEDLGAKSTARELGRAMLGLIGRWSSPSDRLGGSVRRVMTRDVVTCLPSDTLHRAAQIMWDRDCGAVPVVDASGRPAGIITDRDLTMGAFTQGLPLVAIPVGRVASGRVFTVPVGGSVDDVVAVMRSERVRRVVVVDNVSGGAAESSPVQSSPAQNRPVQNGGPTVVGIVALADVARYVAELGPSRRDAALVLADLVAGLSERRPVSGERQRAAE